MSNQFLGQIVMFGGNFAPRSWAFCHGQLLPIAQNTALFSILGTTYGGDGRTTFGLPDLRGRSAIGDGQGPGLSDARLGQKGGVESTTLGTNNMPPHNHPLNAESTAATSGNPKNRMLAAPVGENIATPPVPVASITNIYADFSAAGKTLNSASIGTVGGGQEFSNQSPYQVVNYIIALQGLFPSRS